MNERLKGYLFIIFCFTALWFIILLLCLPQSDNEINQWPQVSDRLKVRRSGDSINHANNSNSRHPAPYAPHYMKPFLSWSPKLSLNKTLFYQFDPISKDIDSFSNKESNLNKIEHDKETSKLGVISNQMDELVKLEGDKLFAFNLLVSNRIGAFRRLPDTRHSKCPKVEQTSPNRHKDEALTSNNTYQKASIIICYYNEAPSALLRTINSLIQRSPVRLVEEIIILDDHSQPGYEIDQIRQYFAKTEVKIITERTSQREGLIRARLYGASLAKGDVLIFLDSHVEANSGWLEPLMSIVRENETTIACPMIDLINAETLVYSASPMVKGGLNWALNFKWDSVPSSKLKTEDDFTKPIDTPTMAGGLYAIRRDYFYRLGAYDREMELWGGENVEMSLRVWMCGGRIVILPCSRLGHIFRKKRPYGPAPNQPDSLLVNSHRTARVWLDDHIEKYYDHYPHARELGEDDISERQQLRESLNCHNFSWFLDNIYPELKQKNDDSKVDDVGKTIKLFKPSPRRIDRSADNSKSVPLLRDKSLFYERFINPQVDQLSEPIVGSKFQIQLADSNLCLQAKDGLLAGGFRRLVLDTCTAIPEEHHHSSNELSKLDAASLSNQLWIQTEMNDLRIGHNQCLDLLKNQPLLRRCHNMASTQEWKAQKNQTLSTNIRNPERRLCLAVEKVQKGEPVIVTICDKAIESYATAPKYGLRRHLRTSGWMTGPIMESPAKFGNEQSLMQALGPYKRWNLLLYGDGLIGD